MVSDVEEYGVLDTSATIFSETEEELSDYGRERFLIQLRSQLGRSESNDVYIFVHGYNVSFENPILMTRRTPPFHGLPRCFYNLRLARDGSWNRILQGS